MMMMMPTGFRFNPTDEELIDILERKVAGKEMPLHDRFIVERNVYELDPHDLQWDHSVMLSSNERYCYYMRETDSREVSGRGWWRATGHVKKIYANNKHVVGYKRPLTFLRFTDNERKRKNGFKTNWIMHEYSLDSNQTEWRLCKIKYKGKASVREELENIKKSYKLRNGLEANNSIMVMQLNFIGEKQQQQPQPFELDSAYEPYSEVSSSMGMQQFEFVCEQQQPQPIELDNLYEPYSEVSSSIGMQHQFDFGGEKHHQPQPIQIDSEDGVYEQNNMQVEVMDHEQQPAAHQSNASYDPILTHIANLNYYFDDQLEQPDSSEELFPSLWSF